MCTLLLGNVAVNSAMAIFLGNIATGLVAGLTATSLIVVFGEIIPQAVFSRNALQLGYKTSWLVEVFIFLFYPIAFPMSLLLDKALGAELATVWNKRELEEIIKHHEDADESEIDEDEERIMLGALAFSDVKASSIATPRTVVFSIPAERSIDQALILEIKKSGFSRIPVYTDNQVDKIQGVLLIKDLLGVDLGEGIKVSEFMRTNVIYANRDIHLDVLLNKFLQNKVHLACLFDQFGSFQGVVSLEDILEQIIKNEIMDESDQITNLRSSAKTSLQRPLLE